MANMAIYQEFMEAFRRFRSESASPNLRSYPEKFRYNDDPEHWEKYKSNVKLTIQLDLQTATIFEIDDRTKRALLFTTPPTDKEVLQSLRLPYRSIFLDLDLTEDDDELGRGERIAGILISEVEVKMNDIFFLVNFLMYAQDNGSPRMSIETFRISFTDIKNTLLYADGTKPVVKILEKLIINTILFVNDPEVEKVDIVRSQKNQERRIREGKMPLPPSSRIVLTGKIKQYFDTHGHHFDGTGRAYTHRFTVRAHWRCFKSDRYIRLQTMCKEEREKLGYKERNGFIAKWIPPFIKGEGVLVKKTYDLKKPKDDNEIDLDAIKPLSKPLAEMKG